MNQRAQEVMQKELVAEEKLVWTGQPQQGVKFRCLDVLTLPFGLIVPGFAAIWEIMAFSGPIELSAHQTIDGVILHGVGILLVLLAVYLLFGRYIFDSRRRAHTFYGITD